jgi:putative transcriptional regulator
MIKYNLKRLISDKEFNEGRKINYAEISSKTGISRQTLSKIASQKGYVTNTENIEKICLYFGCTTDNLMTIVPDDPDSTQKPKSKEQG